MPLYEYQCKACRHVCEVLQGAKDKPLDKCPACGGPMAKRISSPAIQFKGNGWYVTDYAKKGPAPAEKSRAAAGAKPETKADAAEPAKTKPAKTDKSAD